MIVGRHQLKSQRSSLAIHIVRISKNSQHSTIHWFLGIYIQVFGKRYPPSLKLRRDRQLKASFCFEIFCLLCLPFRKSAERLNRKVKDQAERVISTPELNTLLCLHPEPINVVVYHDPSGRSHLGIGLTLRCFQRLSFPNIATQHCR